MKHTLLGDVSPNAGGHGLPSASSGRGNAQGIDSDTRWVSRRLRDDRHFNWRAQTGTKCRLGALTSGTNVHIGLIAGVKRWLPTTTRLAAARPTTSPRTHSRS